MKIVNEQSATPLDAMHVLADRGDLTQEQEDLLSFYRNYMSIQDKDAYTEIMEELESVEDLKPHQIHKLLEVLPPHPATVRAVFEKERINLEENDIKQILSIVDSIRNT